MIRSLPVARKTGLLIEALESEVVIYDLERNQAHCLNAAALAVFGACDGTTSGQQALELLRPALGPGIDEQVVWTAVQQLSEARLLVKPLPTSVEKRAALRNELANRIGKNAHLLPLVVSLAAPTALAAASRCFGTRKPCTHRFECCSGICDLGVCI